MSHSHAPRHSPTSTPPEPALLCSPGAASSPTLKSLRSALLAALGGEGWPWVGYLSLLHSITWQMRGWPAFPHSHSLITAETFSRVGPAALPRRCAGPSLQSSAAGVWLNIWQGQMFQQPQVENNKRELCHESILSFYHLCASGH